MIGVKFACKKWALSGLSMAFSSVIAACYGVVDDGYVTPTPSEGTLVEGLVTAADTGTGIPDIDISCLEGTAAGQTLDDGSYLVELTEEAEMPADGAEITCTFSDVDGETNGAYKTQEASFTYVDGELAELDVTMEVAE